MTTYYVRKSGDDGNDGLSAASAFLTIDAAANVVAAGDTVYIGAGVYRETVTMDTSGSAGSLIQFIGDVSGAQTGDAGLVIVTAWDYEGARADLVRNSTLDVNGKEFFTWENVIFTGGLAANVISSVAGNVAFEGVKFTGCVLLGAEGGSNAYFECNQGATPATTGLTFESCFLLGRLRIEMDENATAERNLKAVVDRCVIIAGHGDYGVHVRRITASTQNIGGVTVSNCKIIGAQYGVDGTNLDSTNFPLTVVNTVFIACDTGISRTGGTADAVVSGGNNIFYRHTTATSNVTFQVSDKLSFSLLFGGFADLPFIREFGWSPWLPWEPIALLDDSLFSGEIGAANSAELAASVDFYGNPTSMGKAVTVFSFDGSDDAITDPLNDWVNQANIVDNSSSTEATTSTVGSESTNYAHAGGATAPENDAISEVYQVRVRAKAYVTNAGTPGKLYIYTDGMAETLATIDVTNTTSTEPDVWIDWTTLTPPAAGWTWADVAALEFKAWGTGGTFHLYYIHVEVTSGSAPDIGPVEARARAEKEETTVRSGSSSLRLDSAGFHDMLVPVSAASTTVSVYGRYDGNYSGDLPLLEVLNIPGVVDQSDAMTGAADTWEQLSTTFTPTESGFVRVRLRSRCESYDGKCFFDDLTVS